MNMKTKLTMVGCLLAMSGVAWSQMQQQLPPSDPGSSQYNSVYLPAHGVGDTVQPDSNVRWEDRWGAIATDDNGNAGIVSDMPSKVDAQRAAITECERRGGRGCDVALAYHNQCAAVSTGNGTKFASAPTEDEAISTSMQECQKGGGECRIYYSGCSLPVRAQ